MLTIYIILKASSTSTLFQMSKSESFSWITDRLVIPVETPSRCLLIAVDLCLEKCLDLTTGGSSNINLTGKHERTGANTYTVFDSSGLSGESELKK